MKRIAILTLFYRNYNYGGLLQGYALKTKIDSFEDANADVLRYSNGVNPIYSNVMQQAKQYGTNIFVQKVFEKVMEKGTFIIQKKIIKRFELCDSFIEECVNVDGIEYTDDNIAESLDKYDCYISGSDQVWNPNCIRNGFLQKFVPDNKIKSSYAASLGRATLSDEEYNIMAPLIKRFEYISVREETARKLLSKNIDKKIEVVCDPVFLLDSSQWEFECSVDDVKPGKYILFYSFSNSKKYRKKVYSYCKENGLKLLYIPYAKQKFNLYDNIGAGEKLFDIGPKEFVYLIKNAHCIFTDSFHGAAFSIIFNKEFYVFERDNRKNKTSMNSRIYDLLDNFGLENRIITLGNISIENNQIHYHVINKKIEEFRAKSAEYLKSILKN